MPVENPSAQKDSVGFSLACVYFSFIVLPSECHLHENGTGCLSGAGSSFGH